MAELIPDSLQLVGKLTSTDQSIRGSLSPKSAMVTGGLDGHGTKDYEHLVNKPKINHVELVGDKSFPELGIRTISSGEILDILNI